MIVKQLIKKLEKLPSTLPVYIADHDHGKYETSSSVDTVELIDKNEMNEIENDKNCGLDDCFTDTPLKYVVIRP